MNGNWYEGKVKTISRNNDFCFLQTEGLPDYFAHCKAFPNEVLPAVGAKVRFITGMDRGRERAISVEVLE